MDRRGSGPCSTSARQAALPPAKTIRRGVVVEYWSALFDNERFADVSFICEGGVRVQANRAALAASSPFFECLLFGSMKEARMGDILLPEVCSHCLRDYILEHLRTGGTPAHANTDELDVVLLAYQLARQYQIASLETALLGRLQARMDLSNAGWMLRQAVDLQADDLTALAVDFLARAWSLGVTGVAIAGMLPNALLQYLQSPMPGDLRVPDEHILDALIEWAKEQLDMGDGVWQGNISSGQREQLTELLSPLLKLVRFDRIPAAVLERKVEPLGILDTEQLMQVYRTQAKQAAAARPQTHERSFWDSAVLPPSVVLADADTLVFEAARGHQAARSKLGLTRGRWVWNLEVLRIGRKYAWAGVVDATVNLDFFPGGQGGGYVFGSGGCTRTKASGNSEEEEYGSYWHRDGVTLTVLLDMEARECSFSVDGQAMGVAFSALPACVYPAVSMSGGGVVKFSSINAA